MYSQQSSSYMYDSIEGLDFFAYPTDVGFDLDLGACTVNSSGASSYTPSTVATCGSQSAFIASKPAHDVHFVSYNEDEVDPSFLTPHLFDHDVDIDLAELGESLELYANGYAPTQSETGATYGSPSTLTTSSATASSDDIYDTLSHYSDSSYGPPPPYHHSFPLDVDTERLRGADDAVPDMDIGTMPLGITDIDPCSFGLLPPVHIPHAEKVYPTTSSSSTDYYNIYKSPPSQAQTTVSPFHISSHQIFNQQSADPLKKHKCPTCHLAFVRKFNLKTHMKTHDTNRVKPYTCHHDLCGRSFSRKHDLTRHFAALHKEDSGTSSSSSPRKRGRSISSTTGVVIGINQGGPRERCDTCGKSRVSLGSNPTPMQCACSYDGE